MADTYTIQYQSPAMWRPKKVEKVVYHWLDDLQPREVKEAPGYVFGPAAYWGVRTEDNKILFIPKDWLFVLMPDHAELTYKKMGSEIGQTIPRQ